MSVRSAARRECSAPLAGVVRGTPEYDRVRASCVTALRARRNQPGGYWIAKDDPRAAREAVTGSRSLAGLNGVALLSNGASRIVSPYGRTDWPGVLDLLHTSGPAGVIARVRQAEAQTTGGADAPARTTPQWPTARTCRVEHPPRAARVVLGSRVRRGSCGRGSVVRPLGQGDRGRDDPAGHHRRVPARAPPAVAAAGFLVIVLLHVDRPDVVRGCRWRCSRR